MHSSDGATGSPTSRSSGGSPGRCAAGSRRPSPTPSGNSSTTTGSPASLGAERIDWTANAGETFYVGLAGDNTNVTLRLANLVQWIGGDLSVLGTAGDDTFVFSAGSQYEVAVNGFDYQFDASAVATVTFTGGAGNDSVVLTGSVGDETAAIFVLLFVTIMLIDQTSSYLRGKLTGSGRAH